MHEALPDAISRVARSTVSGCAMVCMPSDRACRKFGDTPIPLSRSFAVVTLVICNQIPHSTNGAYQRWLALEVNFIADVFHVNIHDVGGRVIGKIPDFFHQGVPGDRTSGIANRIVQEFELACREIYTAAIALHSALLAIDQEVCDLRT